jgi:preprotein translocase subunit SecF
MLKNKKILPILILAIIIVGVVILAIKGMNYGLIYGNNTTIKMNLKLEKEAEDIIKEVFGKHYSIKTANNTEENTIITVKTASEEQINTFITKINEKYELEISNEDLEISNNPKINAKDIIRPYLAPTVITSMIIVLYFVIRYKKLGILKTLITALVAILGTQMVYLSIYAIIRIPVNELAIPISMLILILSFIILAEIFENDILKLKSNKK